MSDDSTMETYRDKCHIDGCDTRFIGLSREKYEVHLREEHSILISAIWNKLVIDE